MRLFGRHKSRESETQHCPRCGQLVTANEGLTCPMCGWDLRDAYQGPASPAPDQTTATTGPTGDGQEPS
jgi:ribosomal protein L37E